MQRIPVVATLRDAYGFASSHLGAVIGLIWLSLVPLTVMGFFSLQRYYNDVIEYLASGNAAQLGPSIVMLLAYIVAALLLYAVAFVGVTQLALGSRTTSPLAHFAFGALEWRMFRAFFAFLGLMLTAMFAILLASNALVLLGGAKIPVAAAGGILFLGLAATGLVLTPRFLLLMPVLAVQESAPVLRRAWALSRGHYWQLLAILLGIMGPLMLVFMVLEGLATGRGQALTGATEQLRLMSAMMRAREILPITCGLGFLFSPVMIALVSGAGVSIWRRLKDEPSVSIEA